ncbi:MAG TPA: division/cell wall cluster transcriptional repressor MraZ [Anaerolineales bacterium]
MFLGQYKYTIDPKGRLTIPVRFRAALSSGAFITQGFDRNLNVFTAESFERLAGRATAVTSTNPEARTMRRLIFSRAQELPLDATGRVLIPTFLREYAGIQADAYVVGAGDYFEIWQTENWEKQLQDVADPEANARRFEQFDLASG